MEPTELDVPQVQTAPTSAGEAQIPFDGFIVTYDCRVIRRRIIAATLDGKRAVSVSESEASAHNPEDVFLDEMAAKASRSMRIAKQIETLGKRLSEVE